MILSLRFLMAWVALHCVVWVAQAYALNVERIEIQCGDQNILICGTPLGTNLNWLGEQPQFALLKAFDFIADQVAKLVMLFAFDYEILYGSGLAGSPGMILHVVGIVAGLGMLITLGYQLFNR